MSTEIHSNVSKEEAYKLMEQGHKITHEYYTDEEYLCMKNGVIYDESGYRMGTKRDRFWAIDQRWESGWMTVNARF